MTTGIRNPVGKPNSRRTLEIAQRRREVAALTLAQLTQTEIAQRIGVSQQTVCEDLKKIKGQWAKQNAEEYETTIARERATLDQLQRVVAARAFLGEHEAVLDLLRILERRARLLGLDRPARVEATVNHEVTFSAAIAIEVYDEIARRQAIQAA